MKEQLAEEYAEGKSSSEIFRKAHIQDFIAGYEAATKWKKVEECNPEEGESVIIKTFDYRRPEKNVTCTTLGYFENGRWFYEEGGVVDEGNGWHIIQWIEIPQ